MTLMVSLCFSRYDNSAIGGHRLYREVHDVQSKVENLGGGLVSSPVMRFLWETLATTPEELQRVAVSAKNSHWSFDG